MWWCYRSPRSYKLHARALRWLARLALWASIQTVAHYTPSMSNPYWSYPSPTLIQLITYIIIIINLLTIPRWTYWSTPLLIYYLVWWVAATARSWCRCSSIAFLAISSHSLAPLVPYSEHYSDRLFIAFLWLLTTATLAPSALYNSPSRIRAFFGELARLAPWVSHS